uniref:Nectin cell adhesion molecule 1a n=1 Tax=Hippocampus comes TaxID=109280 RepID=A0A3Q2Z8B9_HIPCM
LFSLVFSFFRAGGNGQTVEMDDGKSGYLGSKVDLRCRFINSSPPVKISQVTWQKLVNGTKQNMAIANPSLGVSVAPPYKDRVTFKNAAVRRRTPTLEDTTITFSSLRLADEATYICEYTTFPAGNRENKVNLTVYVRPTTQMSLSTPTLVARASNLKTPVATCISANGKPPGVIRWETRVPGEVTTREYRNSDGTFTIQSDYILVPSRETHKETLTCVTSYNDELFTDSVTLDIQYEPDVLVDGYDGNWYLNRENVQLSCQADANPAVSLYQWKLINGSMPSSAEIRDNILIFKGPVTYDLQGTYVCDATNSIGTRSGFVEVSVIGKRPLYVRSQEPELISIDVRLLFRQARRARFKRFNGQSSAIIPFSSIAAPKFQMTALLTCPQHSGRFYEELPNTADYVSYRLACNKEDYPEPYSPPINPAVSFLPQHPYHSPQATTTTGSSSSTSSSKNTFSPPSHSSAIFKYPSVPGLSSPPPGVGAYTFPKEQYV